MLSFHKTQCCAIQELGGLSSYTEGKNVLIDFCMETLGSSNGVKYGCVAARPNTVYSFYLFTAAVDTSGKITGANWYPKYGHNLAEFIKVNKLGEVWESPSLVNDAFHHDHSNVVWIWMPDIKALLAWWKDNKPVTAKKPRVAKPKTVAAKNQVLLKNFNEAYAEVQDAIKYKAA